MPIDQGVARHPLLPPVGGLAARDASTLRSRAWWAVAMSRRSFDGDDLIGKVRNCRFWDMFWTCGDFQPYGRFEQDYRSVFDDFVDGHAGGDQARRTRALQTVRQR